MNEHSTPREDWVTRIDRLGPALVAIVIGLAAVAYLAEAASHSTRLHNMILLVPLVIFTVLACAWVAARHFMAGAPLETADAEGEEEEEVGGTPLSAGGIALMMASLVVYAFVAPHIGFDVASAIFIALCLWIQRERRILFVVVYSVAFSAAITWALAHLAGAAVPTLIIN